MKNNISFMPFLFNDFKVSIMLFVKIYKANRNSL